MRLKWNNKYRTQSDHDFDFRDNTKHVSFLALKNSEWSSQRSLPKLTKSKNTRIAKKRKKRERPSWAHSFCKSKGMRFRKIISTQLETKLKTCPLKIKFLSQLTIFVHGNRRGHHSPPASYFCITHVWKVYRKKKRKKKQFFYTVPLNIYFAC